MSRVVSDRKSCGPVNMANGNIQQTQFPTDPDDLYNLDSDSENESAAASSRNSRKRSPTLFDSPDASYPKRPCLRNLTRNYNSHRDQEEPWTPGPSPNDLPAWREQDPCGEQEGWD